MKEHAQKQSSAIHAKREHPVPEQDNLAAERKGRGSARSIRMVNSSVDNSRKA